MHIDERLKDGMYVDPDGCHWADAESYLQGYSLGFCCCGTPEHSLGLVRDVLRTVSNLNVLVREKSQTWEEWKLAGEQICSEREMDFVFYFLDAKKLTEHGGSIPGWLTPKGEQLLQDLDELLSS